MAEALGIAGSAIAIVELSAKVAKLCVQYSTEAAGARADIQRLHDQVEQLGAVLRPLQRQMEGAEAQSLSISQGLTDSFRDCIAQLERLQKKLGPSPRRIAMPHLGRRALKWPFSSKEVAQILSSLERHEKTILLGLQADQTTILLGIQQGVKQLGIQSTEDASVSRKSHFMMPPPNLDFIHRPEIEQWIRDKYRQPGQRMALVGMGGFGKSQLAVDFAYHVHADEPSTSLFWVYGKSRATFEESYRAIADALSLLRQQEPDVNVLALVRDWLQRDDINPWFMIIDNADDISVFDKRHDDGSSGPIASYLPKSVYGKILVTSRSRDAAEKLVGSSQAIRQIPVMGEDQALELFWNKMESKKEESAAADLILALNCIPLAVSQAAAYINRRSPRATIASYLDEFRKSSKRKDSLLRIDKGDLDRHDDMSNSVVVTWQVTFEQIKRERPSAANLLSLMSQFQAQNIPENMLYSYSSTTDKDHDRDSTDTESSSDDDRDNTDTESSSDDARENTGTESSSDGDNALYDFEDDIDILRGYSLVTLSTAGLFEMHSLVQFCTRSWISEFGDPGRWNGLFLRLAADHFPSGKFETWGYCQSLLPHVAPILDRSPRGLDSLLQWARLLDNVSWYMHTRGELTRAEALAEQAIQTRINILGPDHPLTLMSMSKLASTYTLQGRWEEAKKLGLEVIEAGKVKLGANHPCILISIGNLVWTYREQGRWKEAEKLIIEAIEAGKVKLGANHPYTLSNMSELAVTYREQGRWKEAEKLIVEVIEAQKVKLGADHPFTLSSMNNLALSYGRQGRWEEAEKLCVEVMDTSKAKLGADHPDTLVSMNNLASTWYGQGRQEKALNLMQDCVDLRRKKLGHNHPHTQSSVAALQRWQACRSR